MDLIQEGRERECEREREREREGEGGVEKVGGEQRGVERGRVHCVAPCV